MGLLKTNPSGDVTAVLLPPDCSVRTISNVVTEIRSKISAGEAIVLDGSAVQTADVTFVQFVISAQKSCQAQSSCFQLEHASEAALAAFARSGVPVPHAHSIPGAL